MHTAHEGPASRDGAARHSGRWAWPVPSPHPVLRRFEVPEHDYGPGHRGIDVAAGPEASIHAVEDGVVQFAGSVAGRPVVSIRHADGLVSTYEPVSPSVHRGQRVVSGEIIGTLAEGEVAAPHCGDEHCLHLGARLAKNRYVDPLVLLGARGPSVLLPWAGR